MRGGRPEALQRWGGPTPHLSLWDAQGAAAEPLRWTPPRGTDSGVGRRHQGAVSAAVGGTTAPCSIPDPLLPHLPPCSLFGSVQQEAVQDADSVRLQQAAHQQHSCTLDECFQLYTKEEQVGAANKPHALRCWGAGGDTHTHTRFGVLTVCAPSWHRTTRGAARTAGSRSRARCSSASGRCPTSSSST